MLRRVFDELVEIYGPWGLVAGSLAVALWLTVIVLVVTA